MVKVPLPWIWCTFGNVSLSGQWSQNEDVTSSKTSSLKFILYEIELSLRIFPSTEVSATSEYPRDPYLLPTLSGISLSSRIFYAFLGKLNFSSWGTWSCERKLVKGWLIQFCTGCLTFDDNEPMNEWLMHFLKGKQSCLAIQVNVILDLIWIRGGSILQRNGLI